MKLHDEHKKFNWHIAKSQKFKCTRSELWNIISMPSNLELFHPFCEKNPISNWPGINSADTIHYYNGLKLERNFINWEDNIGYDLIIGTKNGEKSFVSWRIKERDNISELTIAVYPYLNNRGSKITNFLPFFIIIRPSLGKYLNSVLQGLEFYSRTNKKVKKNQFGTHNFFSN
jgi:hypothetical protein